MITKTLKKKIINRVVLKFGQWNEWCNSVLVVAMLKFEILLEGKARKKQVFFYRPHQLVVWDFSNQSACASLCIIHKIPYLIGNSEINSENENRTLSISPKHTHTQIKIKIIIHFLDYTVLEILPIVNWWSSELVWKQEKEFCTTL